MTLNVDALQELEPAEEVGLACPIVASCCAPILPWMPTFTFVSCFGCTITR